MRPRLPYTLLPRRSKNGVVWYFRTYDSDRRRTTARSTGKTTKTAAHAWCQASLKRGDLEPRVEMTFAAFAADWWRWGVCSYLTRKIGRGGTVSRLYADIQRQRLQKYLIPAFGRMGLVRIATRHVDRFVDDLRLRALAPATVN